MCSFFHMCDIMWNKLGTTVCIKSTPSDLINGKHNIEFSSGFLMYLTMLGLLYVTVIPQYNVQKALLTLIQKDVNLIENQNL